FSDVRGIDAIDVLQVIADVREAMLHWFDCGSAGQRLQLRQHTAGREGRRTGNGYIRAMRKRSIHASMRIVGSVENSGRSGKGEGQRDEYHSSCHTQVLSTERR